MLSTKPPKASRAAAHLCFGLFLLLSCTLFRAPLYALAHLAIHDEHYSHIALIPFISAFPGVCEEEAGVLVHEEVLSGCGAAAASRRHGTIFPR